MPTWIGTAWSAGRAFGSGVAPCVRIIIRRDGATIVTGAIVIPSTLARASCKRATTGRNALLRGFVPAFTAICVGTGIRHIAGLLREPPEVGFAGACTRGRRRRRSAGGGWNGSGG